MLARCIRRCWDSQTTKRYFIGNVDDLPEDHIFLTMKNPCFEKVKPEDLVRNQNEAQVQLQKAFEMIADLTKKIEEMGGKVPEPPKIEEAETTIPEEFPIGEAKIHARSVKAAK